MEPKVIDRTRRTSSKAATPYEVVLYHTEFCWEQETGSIVARFHHAGDAFLWAKTVREPVYCIVVRN